MFKGILLGAVCILFPLTIAQGADIYVPDHYSTIQDAINAALDGDNVIVRPGTYVENIDFVGKAIAVKSEGGAGVTIIDGNQAGSVVTFQNGEIADSVLDGFTATNGNTSNNGGGISCKSNSSPTITNNIITDNWASSEGGGISCERDSSPTITNNTIMGNTASWCGGGIGCDSSSPTILNNTITGNLAAYAGGIFCEYSSSPTIMNNSITENTAYGDSGGIFCIEDSSPTITNNTITGNTAGWDGGGIYCWESSPAITNNTISRNTTNDNGGGIYCEESSSIITNNTISGNSAGLGGGIYCDESFLTITNTILWDNSAPTGKEIWIGTGSYPSTLTISYSDVEGGQSSVYVYPGSTLNWGNGMIKADPLFVDPTNDDYCLQQDPCQQGVYNPCVDTGDPTSSMIEGSTRTDRFQDQAIVDMGYHYPACDWIYVPDDYNTIQDAINGAADGDNIIVRPGTYVENIDFIGKAITVKSEGGAGVTMIDGNQAGSVVTFQSREGADSVLDGFTVMNGNASYSGGGINCGTSSPTITNNTITGNTAAYYGGGINCYISSPAITNTIISGNTTYYYDGGGIACFNYSSPTITKNMITGNSALGGGGGGGISCEYDSSPTITNNTISGNTTHSDGGGISCEYNSTPTITNNTISENSADWASGGGIYCYFSDPAITNNTISGNTTYSDGGGICCVSSSPTITNTILWDNTPGQILVWSGSPTVTYCDVQGGWSGTGNIDADPFFADSGNDDYHLTWPSPCRNTGDNSTVTELYDFEGDPRIHDSIVDMGADEFHLHLYYLGDAVPGGIIDVKVVGEPGTTQVILALGSGILDPPQQIPYGDLYLQLPILLQRPMPDINADGLSMISGRLPGHWIPGEQYPCQAMAGMKLTNLMVIEVQ